MSFPPSASCPATAIARSVRYVVWGMLLAHLPSIRLLLFELAGRLLREGLIGSRGILREGVAEVLSDARETRLALGILLDDGVEARAEVVLRLALRVELRVVLGQHGHREFGVGLGLVDLSEHLANALEEGNTSIDARGELLFR